ncbi:MAG TPA: Gfo/Idh/MocA family oxidoreductase [Jatrophihabitans sp.]|nr:Gfo/Idh/MocA family oxidoreductase [Jatrophihabitans sp.]
MANGSPATLRIGLVGTGYWARATHATGLRAQPAVSLTGVWGRDRAATAAVAAEFGIAGYASFEELLDEVDAVGFSVPPHVQSELATRAAERGKHLLLEKPVAVTERAAAGLAGAVAEAGVASVVFFTSRFDAARRAWLADRAAQTGWDGASGLWLGSAFEAGSPFDTPWRHDKGGLWDVGPHALSLLAGALGPIAGVTARAGHRDLVQLLVEHSSGALASYALSIDTPAASRTSLLVWGSPGSFELPPGPGDPAACLATAAGELATAAAAPGAGHPCDVRFGHRVVQLLAEAERQLS